MIARALLWIAILGAFGLPDAAMAQGYPARPIRLISPYAPGGSNDIVTRLLGKKLADALQTPVLVENRPGGGMLIGTEMAARAPADGHTLILVSSGHAINPSLRKDLPYDTNADFAAVGLVGWMPNVMVVNPALPVRSVEELVSLARNRRGSLNYSSAGNASTPHLATEWFKSLARIEMTHIPYKGTGPSLTDLVGGQVALTICGIAPALAYIKGGKLRAIAVTSAKRTPLAPELPTVAERGYPGYEVVTWYGVLAPAATPKSVVAALSKAITGVVRSADSMEQLAAQGVEAIGSGPEEFATFIRSEIARWERVVVSSGMRAD